LNQGVFNTKTFGQEGDLQITNVQWIPNGTPLPSNWKTGGVTPAANAPANNTPAPRPRDGLQNWMKQ
jgi:hypothetical protein